MAARYKNYLGYDKRDYHYPEKADAYGDEENASKAYVEEPAEWDDASMAAFEFLRDKVEEMAVPILDQHFGLFDVFQLLSMHAKKNKNTI